MIGRRLLLAAFVGATAAAATASVGSATSLNVTSNNLTPYRTCTIVATPATTTSVLDASVRQATPTTNVGTATTNNVATQSAANRRLYQRFDLAGCNPAIPSSAVIRLATLRLYLSAVPTTCRTIDIFRVTSTWGESTITWNNQPFGVDINSPAAGTASDTVTIGTPAGCTNQATGVFTTGATVTADVASWVAGTTSNFGWMLRDDVEGSATAYTITTSAKELATVAQAPQLVVTYVVVP